MKDDYSSADSSADAFADAYAHLQLVVGVLALLLPIGVLLIEGLIDGRWTTRSSISEYYYSRSGGFFVGNLCAQGVFFLSYEYHPRAEDRRWDNLLGDLAFVLSVGVALLPTASRGGEPTGGAKYVSWAHAACATILFLLLAVFSLYHFTKTTGEVNPDTPVKERFLRIFRTRREDFERMTSRKRARNRVYRTCGWLIVAAIVTIPIASRFNLDVTFPLESLAVFAFGVSWLVKSDMLPFLLRDVG